MRLRSKWLYTFGAMTIMIALIVAVTFGILFLLADPVGPDIDTPIDESGGSIGIGGGWFGDGGGSGDGEGGSQGDPVLSVYSDKAAYVYFRAGSYGNYMGKSWGGAESYQETVDGYGMQNSTSDVLETARTSSYRLEVTLHSAPYVYPYHNVFGSGEVVQANDVVNDGHITDPYSASFYDYFYQFEGNPHRLLSYDWWSAERQYRDFVYDEYLYVPSSTRSYLQTIIDSMKFDASDTNIIDRVLSYVHYAARYDTDYNTALDGESDVVRAFLSEYKVGNSAHFASATTLLFRTLGIPARYTVGYVCRTKAEETVDVYAYNAHAWTEVYLDGFGWVNVDATNPQNGPSFVPPFEFTYEEPQQYEDSQETTNISKPHLTGEVMLSVYSDSSVYTYLKTSSYGDYTGRGWGSTLVYDETVDGYGLQNSTSAQLSSLAIPTYGVEVTLYTSSFPYPYHTVLGDGDIRQTNDVVNKGNSSEPYTGTFYDYMYQLDGRLYGSFDAEWAAAERQYREFVYENYLDVPSGTKSYLQTIIREEGFDASDPDIIERVAGYVHNAAAYNLNYNSSLDSASDIVVAFLRDYKTGVCQHFASATTLLLRTLGIPARYTVGYVCHTSAGETVDVTDYDGHAWTEVYLDGFGWVNIESTGTGYLNDSNVPPIPFPDEPEKEYEDSGETTVIDKPDYTGKVIFSLYSEVERFNYYRSASYGDYTGQGWDSTKVYDITYNGYGMQNIISNALGNSRKEIYDIMMTLYGYEFVFPYYNVMDSGLIQGNDVVNEGDLYFSYGLSVYNYDYERDGIPSGSLSATWASYERAYRKFVQENYLSVPDATESYLKGLLRGEGISGTSYSNIQKVIDYVRGAARFNKDYDATLDASDDIVVAFLSDYKEGDSQHFASAATLMLRTLGFPARYTKGYSAKTESGMTVDVTDESAHAWVEVYINGFGWVAVDATPVEDIPGGSGGGSGGGGDLDTSGDIFAESGDGDGDPTVAFTVYSDTTTYSYFRLMSYGDYRMNGWNEAPVCSGLTDGYGMQNSTSALLSQAGTATYNITVELKGKQFFFPYFTVLGSGGIVQADDVTNYGDTSQPYSASFYDYNYQQDGLPSGSLTGVWAENERVYREFVYANYLTAPTSTAGYINRIIAEQGFDPGDPDIINKVARYVQNAATYNLEFDPALNYEDDIVVAFLRDYKEGICRHFASAATLIYRMLGIPARYTIGYAAQTKAGQTVDVTTKNAHAWVEVYLDGFGWVNVEVTPSSGQPGGGPGGGGGGDSSPPELDTSGDIGSQPNSGGGVGGETPVAFHVYSDKSVYSYFRLMSFGEYRYSGWNEAVSYGGTVQGYGLQNTASQRLARSGADTYTVTVEILSSQFLFPYYTVLGSGGIVQRDDVTNYGDTSTPYSASFFDYDYLRDGLPGGSLTGEWASAERAYRDFVYDNYRGVTTSTLRYLNGIIREEGWDASDPAIIQKVAEYVQNAAVYNMGYDHSLDASDDIIVAFLRDYKEGICQHFASAATLIYRALGIPARYTIGYAAQTKAGETVDVTTKNAHAWVEVYIDGLGWVNVEVTPSSGQPGGGGGSGEGSGGEGSGGGGGGGGGGGDEQSKYELTVTVGSATKVYDGTPLWYWEAGNFEWEGDLQSDHWIMVSFMSGPTDVGVVSNDIEVTVYDRYGNDVTDEYSITKICGTLTVLPRPVTIETFSASKPYDGTPLTAESAHRGGFIGNETISIDYSGSQTERGSSLNTIESIVIRNEDGRDVTSNYSIEVTIGTLRVY